MGETKIKKETKTKEKLIQNYNLSYEDNLKLIKYKESQESYNYYSSLQKLTIKELNTDYAVRCTQLNDKKLEHKEYLVRKKALDLAYNLQKRCLFELYMALRIFHTTDDVVSETEQQAIEG